MDQFFKTHLETVAVMNHQCECHLFAPSLLLEVHVAYTCDNHVTNTVSRD